MKTLLKVFLFLTFLNFALWITFLSWVFFYVIPPSLKDSGITFIDLLKNDLDAAEYEKLEQNVVINSKKLGKQSAEKFSKMIESFFYVSDSNYNEMVPVE